MSSAKEKKELKDSIKKVYGELKKMKDVSLKNALKSLHEIKKKVR
ncbi:MAG: hypothetical protein PHH60_02755 [Candidatus Margulisbacteria bacterium]|nr:hypothetical protein [Candidatus Margulisiibacteriota bacterium]